MPARLLRLWVRIPPGGMDVCCECCVLSIRMDLREVGERRGDWMESAQDGDRWRALVNAVKNFRVPKRLGIS
jgi:hypothetical protein